MAYQRILRQLKVSTDREEHRLKLRRPTVWTAKESKAAVQSMRGSRPKKSTRVVERIKTRGITWTELERVAYGYPPIYGTVGTLTKDPHESREHREPRHPAMAETNSHVSRDLDRAELTVISNIGSSPDEYSEPNEEPRPVSYGSSPSTNRSSRHQRMGSYDTSLTESLLHSTISPAETEDYYGSISSAGVTNYNGSSQIATPSAYSSSSGFVALSIGSELEDTHICTELITPLDCSLFLTEIGLEVSSVVINLLSSPEKPHYALAGMLCANVAVLLSILELIYEGIKKRELLASQNTVRSIIMMLPEITGFGLATFQSISSVVQFYNRHEHNQLNIYLGGVYACFCLFLFKFGRKLRNQ